MQKPLQPLYATIFKGHQLRKTVTGPEVHYRISLSVTPTAVPEQLSRKPKNPYFKLCLYNKEDCITSCKGHLGLILISNQWKSKFFLVEIYGYTAVRGNHASCLHNELE